MRIGIHAGHNPDGKIACGAIGLIKESTEARKVKDEVIRLLKLVGHTVYDCTVDNGTSQSDVINKILSKSNAQTLDLTVSIHFNSGRNDKNGDGDNAGVEVLMTEIEGIKKDVGTRICNNIAKLGYDNRGNKVDKKLGFLNKSKAKAILVECCFVDDADDVKLYNYKTMAKAIAEGIHGSSIKDNYNSTSSDNSCNYVVKIITDSLNVRKGPSTSYDIATTVKKGQAYTIVEENNNWGKLKSGAGWISLNSKYVQKI